MGEEERRSRGRTELIVRLDGVKWDELMKLTAHEVCCLRGFAWLFSEGHRLNLFFWTFSVAQFDRIKLHTILLLLKTLL